MKNQNSKFWILNSERYARMMLYTFILAFFALPFVLSATDLTPWLTKDFEFQPRATILYQTYPKIATSHHHGTQSGDDQFYTLGVELSAFDYSAELETTIAHTRRQHYAFDNVRLTGRYRIMDDIPGDDPVSLTAGVTITQAFKHSLHDVSSFHHGQIEGEAHLTVGKETPFEEFWMTRWWTVFAIGMGDRGAPWIRTETAWEKNWWDRDQLRLFVNTLWGLGGRDISSVKHFGGYGPIDHQSIDLGMRYSHFFECTGTLSLEYAHRAYARNFPEHANLLMLTFVYPFGL